MERFTWRYTVTDRNTSSSTNLRLVDRIAPVADGPRQELGDAKTLLGDSWLNVATGVTGHMTAKDPGIMTTGQFQCICIIVAQLNAEDAVTEARLLHVSSSKSSKIREIAECIKASDADTKFVAVVALRKSMVSVLGEIEATLNAKNPYGLIEYVGDITDEPNDKFGFGLAKTGFFGQVNGKV